MWLGRTPVDTAAARHYDWLGSVARQIGSRTGFRIFASGIPATRSY